ncbi:hypothetical protein HRG84_13600 [Flavisolibacter sp. BT320]|nr:hypothetical protein [Flavisolibacter longurius]
MKQILFLSLAALLFIGCQKDLGPIYSDYVKTVSKSLQDSLHTADFQLLDFSKAARSRVDSVGVYFLRVPFRGKKSNVDFVLVKTNKAGIIESGRIIHLQGKIHTTGDAEQKVVSWNGTISSASLDRQKVFESKIENGYITALHQTNRFRVATQEPQGEMMPEVIITYFKPSGGGDMYWSPWFMFHSFLAADANGGSGGGGGYYSDFSGGGSSGGGGSYGDGSTGGSYNDPVIRVDMETQDLREGIDINKYVACFSSIPDAGSSCSIEISTDIPVDDNPNAFYNFSTGSPGHAFITITKKNGAKYVSQNIGFYPKSGYKAMTYAPTAGKLVDNAKHEFNASLFMNITPAQLATVLVRMQQLSNINYDVDSYNCADWALDIFNSVRTNKLDIPMYGIPDSPMTQGSRTPQGIYHKLQQMMASTHPEKGNITIGIIKGYAGGSNGPCN